MKKTILVTALLASAAWLSSCQRHRHPRPHYCHWHVYQ